jgi:hypothetical protein
LPQEWRTITLSSLNLDDSHPDQTGRFRHLWESGQRVRTLQKYYDQAPARIIPAVLAAWKLVQKTEQPLTPEDQKAIERILEHAPEP